MLTYEIKFALAFKLIFRNLLILNIFLKKKKLKNFNSLLFTFLLLTNEILKNLNLNIYLLVIDT